VFGELLSYPSHSKDRIACSRRSDSGARAKNKARERAGKKKNEGRLFFARAPLSERLEQAKDRTNYVAKISLHT